MESQPATPYQARLHQERVDRLRRLGARSVPDKPISLSKPKSGLNGYAAALLKRQQREKAIEDHKQRIESETLEERLSRLRNIMVVKYDTNGIPPTTEPPKIVAISVDDIQRAFCKAVGTTRGELLSDRRHQPLVHNRQLCMMLCKALTLKSYPEIGRMFGGKDHTTVLHAIRRMSIVEDQVRARLPVSATLLQWVNETLAVFHALPKGALKGRGIVKSNGPHPDN